jgi:hypothetical protein
MGLPLPSNVTVDVYRNSNPASPVPGGMPAVPGVPGNLIPRMATGRYGSALWLKWTHLLLLPAGTDVRDAYNSQLDPARNNNAADTVVVTDSNGNRVPYYVAFVEEAFRGSPFALIRVYLDRFQPQQWPTDGI